ncbi:MAG: hypothetical protein C6I01_01240 [Epsilonproteobacteria bacterium]|jgi:TPR repeat protein|nr:hypothetical protein [Campylobacterota bacterium]NPA88975.1 sel1 repeat family protein [Campylobacterota bacterium]
MAVWKKIPILFFIPVLGVGFSLQEGEKLITQCIQTRSSESCLTLEKEGEQLQKRCELGDSKSCGMVEKLRDIYREKLLATMEMEKGKSDFSREKKEKELEKRCLQGDGEGCRILGENYEKGKGVPTSVGLAYELYQKGCKKGDGKSCYYLGEVWEGKKALIRCPANPQLALKFYQKSCKLGYQPGCERAKTLSLPSSH